MGLISIGTHTLTRNPANMTPIEEKRFNTFVETYSSVAHFSWGFLIKGLQVTLTWPYMTNTEYEQIRTLYLEDEEKILNPNDGSGRTFNVQMMDFAGTYFKGRYNDSTASRTNVKLELLVMSEN